MPDNKAKGDLFQHVLAYVRKKWGRDALEDLDKTPEQYRPAEWYAFSEFCTVLTDINAKLGDGDDLAVFHMGCEMIKNDFRWRTIFKGRSPVYVFKSTKRQDTQYTGGVNTANIIADKHIRIAMSGWDCDYIWYEFIKGRLQGVLELTGNNGTVDMTEVNESDHTGFTYDITWE